MKQIGNLAVICAQRPEIYMQIYGSVVSVHVGAGPERTVLHTVWDNDAEISRIVYELNFGRFAVKPVSKG